MKKWYRNSHYTIFNADSFEWLRLQRANSFQAVVTDPPFGVIEYSSKELNQLKERGAAASGGSRTPLTALSVRRCLDSRFSMIMTAWES